MKKTYFAVILLVVVLLIVSLSTVNSSDMGKSGLKLAVEYNTHAASAFIAQEKGWLPDNDAFDVYVTGVALAGAITKGEVDAAYICLVPALTAYANGDVPLKIICGTHKYGYGLIVDTSRIKSPKDLENPDIRIGCVREGGTTDVFLNKVIERYSLDKEKVLKNVLRMNPAKQVMALKAKQLDAIVVPEHFTILAKQSGFEMLLKAQDVWPDLQGSVLVVTEKFLKDDPAGVKNLYKKTLQSTDYLNNYPNKAAEIVAKKLNAFQETASIKKINAGSKVLDVSPEMISRSLENISYDVNISEAGVQEVIDYLFKLGYIKKKFSASEVLIDPNTLTGGK